MQAVEDFYAFGGLACFSSHNTPLNVEGLPRLRDQNINVRCLSAFADFDGAGLERIAHVGMESLGIIDIPRYRRSNPFRLRNARADQVQPLRHPDYAIDALLISHLYSRVVEGVRLRFPVGADLGQLNPLSAQRAPLGIGDPPRDYASSLEY